MNENKESVESTEPETPMVCDPRLESRKIKVDRAVSLVVAIFILLVTTFLLIVDLNELEFSSDMRILGPGAFPAFVFVILIVLDLLFIFGLLTGKGGSTKLGSHIEMFRVKKALKLFLLIVVCIFLMSYIGFVLSMMLFTFVEMRFLSEKKLKMKMVLISTILLPIIIYATFVLLNVPLPSVSWIPFI